MVRGEIHRCQIDMRSHPRGVICPSHVVRLTLAERKGAGKTGAPAGTHKTPVLNECTRNAQGKHRAAETRPSLRDGLTAYAALSREPTFPLASLVLAN